MPYNRDNISAAVYLGLGSNLGDREANLQKALKMLSEQTAIKITRVSSIYETAPVGIIEQPDFLNLVAEAQTTLEPQDLLAVILNLENQMGRVRNLRWGPRVIDVDLLIYGSERLHFPGLTVPHPRLLERAFVLVPLVEIAPDLQLTDDGLTAAEALKKLFQLGNISSVVSSTYKL